jgi:hypothetical protein
MQRHRRETEQRPGNDAASRKRWLVDSRDLTTTGNEYFILQAIASGLARPNDHQEELILKTACATPGVGIPSEPWQRGTESTTAT